MLDVRPARFSLVLPLLIAALVAARSSDAQGPNRASPKVYPDTSFAAEALLRNADNHAKGGQYAEAIEIYQRVIQQFGDKVVEVVAPPAPAEVAGKPAAPGVVTPDDSKLFVDARLDCQRRIAELPPEARAFYRARVDSQAERWFKQGQADRDRSALRRVIEEAFCSSWGDDALELLGDLSFQEGQFAEALSAYRQLVPDGPAVGRGMTHPDPSVNLARVAAKALLCRAAMGENPPTAADLAAYAKAYPDAKGEIAGRTGPLAKSLSAAIGEDKLSAPAQPDGRWPTFAGSPTRSRIAPSSIDVGSLQWRVDLAPISPSTPRYGRRMQPMATTMNVPADRLLAYHPIVIGEQVVICDEKSVTAYNLNQRPTEGGIAAPTATIAWRHEHQGGGFVSEAVRPHHGLARYTLTAFGDRIYARMGPPPAAPMNMGMGRMGPSNGGSSSTIVALDRAAEGKLLWKRSASEIVLPKRKPDGANRSAAFEGTPVADARNVYVALTDRAEMTATYVACLDAETGVTRWVRFICEANSNVDPFSGNSISEISHRLLTLDGPTLYYQTNLGAVVSLDVEAGSIRWLATYPWESRRGFGQSQDRDLNPAIAHNGLVIVAPDDAQALFAFDAATGRMVWKTRPLPDDIKLAHVLGVAKGKVVATGDRVLLFDVKTGALVRAWPDGGQSPQGFGRGILAGERIYWPTSTEIHVLDQETGLIAEPPIRLKEKFQTGGGNLAVGDGFLIVAQGDAMVVFCQLGRLIERYRDEIARAPERASNYYRMAQAAEASGLDDLALSSLDQVVRRARISETIDGFPLIESARDHQHKLLMRQGDLARKAKNWTSAAARFARAAESARSDRDRLAARLDLADVQLRGGTAALSVVTLQSLLADERLRPLVVSANDGRRSVRADLLIADRLLQIVREHGRGCYAEFDRAAKVLLDRGITQRDPRLLADVGRSYPAAESVPDADLALGGLFDSLKQPQDAARAYRRLAASDASNEARARAYWGLARAYEAQRLWQPAREIYRIAAARFGETSIGPDGKLADLVPARLIREPFNRMADETGDPALRLPLVRRWGRQWPATLKPIAADGVPPSPEQGRIFLVEGSALRAIDPTTGGPAWTADLGSEPVWVGYLSDRLIAATRTKLAALNLDKGAVEWQYDLAASEPKGGPNPFARRDPAEPVRDGVAGQFRKFRIEGGRVFCLRCEPATSTPDGDSGQEDLGSPKVPMEAKSLMAFDGDTGQVDWSYGPATGRINPRIAIGPNRIVFQVRGPNAVIVLDTATGRRRGEFSQGEAEEWPRAPLRIDDDHVALVIDRRTVAMFDLNRGVNAWIFRESSEMPKYGPPRLVGDGERLLVLNNGVELIRLDAATGSKRWSRPLGDENLSERPDAFALGGDRFFFSAGSDLTALAIADGTIAWRSKLIGPELGWSVALTDRCVAAYPNPSRMTEDDLGPILPIVFRRRDTGDLVQRLLFPAPVTELTVKLAPRSAFIATQAGLWALGDRK
jgi:outer membrane protein assembly factor BamB